MVQNDATVSSSGSLSEAFSRNGQAHNGTRNATLYFGHGNVTLFGIAVVYLLLSANIIHYFIGRFTAIPASMCMVSNLHPNFCRKNRFR
ncbi:hypothetical protein OSTOST_23844, partial [Ostertagia ostertagi]